jgi:5-methylcytosine-specific restriction endonuclease McrA
MNQWHGQKWIRNEKRIAIYLRDGLACAYCGATVESGAQVTLDHLKPRSKGGSNEARNLVTTCHKCNSARGNRPWRKFASVVAEYLDNGIDPKDIERHVRSCTRRKLNIKAAKELIANRGGFFAAVYGKEYQS